MTALFLSLACFLSTLAGGFFVLRFHHKLHYILSFAAGVLIGVVSFELLPEIFRLSQEYSLDIVQPMAALVAGFLLFHTLEKCILLHHTHEDAYAPHRHPHIGVASALAASAHSFVDGVGIGLGFHISPAVGFSVALAVLAHDFCDGINTVSLMLMNRNSRKKALLMLVLDAVAPVLGAASTFFFALPPGGLAVFLGFFAGFLLYISASDILPEAHSQAPARRTFALVALTCLGTLLAYIVAKV